ncbi:MAG: CelD/BcsL family acetyltransferase involved in cellulose biosynthesis, partial [Paraglaciecola sp.]
MNSINVISTLEQLNLYKDKIDALNKVGDGGTIFSSVNWIFIWWKTFSSNNDLLRLIIVFDDDEVVGFCPLYVKDGKTLMFVGTGEDERIETCPEYLDIVYLKEHRQVVSILIQQWMMDNDKAFSECLFVSYLKSSLMHSVLCSLPNRFISHFTDTGVQHLITLSQNMAAFIARIESTSFKKKLNRLNNIIDSDNRLTIRYLTNDDSDFCDVFTQLKDLHQQRWAVKGEDGAFASTEFNDFHLDFGDVALKQGKAVLAVISLDGKPIAITYCLISNNTCHYYQSGIDDNVPHKYSPGHIMHLAMMRYCLERHIKHYDFMRGTRQSSYKDKYSTERSDMGNMKITMLRVSNI